MSASFPSPAQIQQRATSGLNNVVNLFGMDSAKLQRLNRLMDMFQYAKQHRELREPKWLENFEFYLNIDRELLQKGPYDSKLFVPRPYLVVETKTPRITQAVIGKDPIWTVKPVSRDDEEKARSSSEILTHQVRNSDNVMLELTLWFKDAFIFGGSIGKSGWEFKKSVLPQRVRTEPRIDVVTASIIGGEDKIVLKEVVEKDQPFFNNVDIGEYYGDPNATSIEDSKFMIHRQIVSRHLVEYLGQLGIFIDVNRIPTNREHTGVVSDFVNRRFSVRNFTDPFQVSGNPFEYIELLEFWWIDERGQKLKSVVANRAVIVQDGFVPYWHNRFPFYLLKDCPMTKEFWGIGEIQPIRDLVKEANSLRNQDMDMRNRILKPFYLINRTAGINTTEFENVEPGGYLETSLTPKESIEVFRPPSFDNLTFNASQRVDLDIQLTTGVNDLAFGQQANRQIRNATTGSLMAEATNTRHGLTALLFLQELRKVGRDWLAMNQQYLSTPVYIRVLGQDGLSMIDKSFSFADIPQQYDLYVTAGSELQGDVEVKRQQSLQLFTLLSAVPGFQITEFAKEILREFGRKNPERFFEGSFIVPTDVLMQELGMSTDTQPISKFQEMQGGALGGYSSAVNRGAQNRGDVLDINGNLPRLANAGLF